MPQRAMCKCATRSCVQKNIAVIRSKPWLFCRVLMLGGVSIDDAMKRVKAAALRNCSLEAEACSTKLEWKKLGLGGKEKELGLGDKGSHKDT